jgi:hypothetical protein
VAAAAASTRSADAALGRLVARGAASCMPRPLPACCAAAASSSGRGAAAPAAACGPSPAVAVAARACGREARRERMTPRAQQLHTHCCSSCSTLLQEECWRVENPEERRVPLSLSHALAHRRRDARAKHALVPSCLSVSITHACPWAQLLAHQRGGGRGGARRGGLHPHAALYITWCRSRHAGSAWLLCTSDGASYKRRQSL